MKALTFFIIGGLLAVFGAVFTFQGLGYLGGSSMTNDPLWAILGPIIALVGVVLIVIGARGKKSG